MNTRIIINNTQMINNNNTRSIINYHASENPTQLKIEMELNRVLVTSR